MSIYGRDDLLISVGDKVKHFDRKHYDCTDNQDYVGVVVILDPDRYPLVGVDCGVEFIRWLPSMDIIHC